MLRSAVRAAHIRGLARPSGPIRFLSTQSVADASVETTASKPPRGKKKRKAKHLKKKHARAEATKTIHPTMQHEANSQKVDVTNAVAESASKETDTPKTDEKGEAKAAGDATSNDQSSVKGPGSKAASAFNDDQLEEVEDVVMNVIKNEDGDNGTSNHAKKTKQSSSVLTSIDEGSASDKGAKQKTGDNADKPKGKKGKLSEHEKVTQKLLEIKEMQEALPPAVTIANMAHQLQEMSSFERGHELFELFRKYGNASLDEKFMLRGVESCLEAGRARDALDILQDMISQGRKIETTTFMSLLDLCEKTNAAVEGVDLWRTMERAGLKLSLQDLDRLLTICEKKKYLSGAVAVLQELRLHRKVHRTTYTFWLHQASRIWDSEAFFDLLMEMRLAGVEPEISSLTSLETGRKDKALTVMEGVRAVGLDPCFAMHAVLADINTALFPKKSDFGQWDALLKRTSEQFKDSGLPVRRLEWDAQPIPQLLETQAAGLILRQESMTFKRMSRKQVNRIDSLLQMLPITTNVTMNLRKQLQRMSLLVNTHRVRREVQTISDQYESGTSLISLSKTHNYPPVSLLRIILRHRGFSTTQIKRALNSQSELLTSRDQHQLRRASNYDSLHRSDPFLGPPEYNKDSLEVTIEHYFRSQGIRVKTEEDLGLEQIETHGRRVLSPDLLLLDPVEVNGTPIRWVDAKNYYGAHLVGKKLIAKQLENYVKEWGPGAIVFGMGYSDMFDVPGVICLDTSALPETRTGKAKMRVKSMAYTALNSLRWKEGLSSDLTQEYEKWEKKENK